MEFDHLQVGVNPKIGVLLPHKSSHFLIGFGTINKTIHFGIPLFFETPRYTVQRGETTIKTPLGSENLKSWKNLAFLGMVKGE